MKTFLVIFNKGYIYHESTFRSKSIIGPMASYNPVIEHKKPPKIYSIEEFMWRDALINFKVKISQP